MPTLTSTSTGQAVETDHKIAPGSRYINKSLPTITGRWIAQSTATVDYLDEKQSWLSSWTRDCSSNYVLAYRYHVEAEDREDDSSGEKGADFDQSSDGKTNGRTMSRRYATIFRWELVLVWEYLRQVAKTRYKILTIVEGKDFDLPDWRRLCRWMTSALQDFEYYSSYLDQLADYESLGQIPRKWKETYNPGTYRKPNQPCESFEAGFFAAARSLLDGFAVDAPAGYPLEQTRKYFRDGEPGPTFIDTDDPLRVIKDWDDWIQTDERIRNCNDRSESSGSSVSKIDARLEGDDGERDRLIGTASAAPERLEYIDKLASSTLTRLYEVERSTWKFSPEFWGKKRLISTNRRIMDTPLRWASEKFESGQPDEKEALHEEFLYAENTGDYDVNRWHPYPERTRPLRG